MWNCLKQTDKAENINKTKAKTIIGKSFRVKSMNVSKRTRENNNQGEKAETM